MINILQHGNLIGQPEPEDFSVFFSSSFCRLFKLPTWKMMITLFIFFAYVYFFLIQGVFVAAAERTENMLQKQSHIFRICNFLAEYMRRIRDSPNSALCDDFLAYEWNLYMLCSMDVVENCFPTYSNFSGNFINYASSPFIK